MKYLISRFRKKWPNTHERKKYKNIDEACVEEDKILSNNKNLKWILIESKKTWRILLSNNIIKDEK